MHPLTRLSRTLVFHPSATRHDASSTTYDVERDGVHLRGWVTNPGTDRAMIYFGGNAEDTSLRQSALSETLPDRTTYLIAYRGFGASDGQPSEQDVVADSIALFEEVARHHEQVAILGRSLGSAVASQVASAPSVRDRVDQVILVTPFDSAGSVARWHSPWWLPVHRVLKDHFRSDLHVGNIRASILVLRAGQDTVIAPELTDRLVSLLPRQTRVIDFPHADHQTILEEQGYWPAVQQFLDEG